MRAPAHRAVGLAVCLAVIAGGLAAGGTARARTGPRLTVAPRAGHVGQLITVHGYGFRPRRKGFVALGARRVASFRATGHGTFLVRFSVPAAAPSGRLRVIAEQTARGRRGSIRRLKLARTLFRVVFLGGAGSGGGSASGSGGAGGASSPGGSHSPNTPGGSSGHWAPPEHLTWYWQLQGTVDNNETVEAYDIDGFENTAAEVATLHSQGKHVICYIDVGTYEPDRPDTSSFPSSVLGDEVAGWPGEKWLDIRQLSTLEPIMTARFQMCKEKGFDAVEPDNMDGYENTTGFPLTAPEQLTYDEWVATEIHSLGMAVLQKNDGEQTSQLAPYFDGALTEECNVYDECANFDPYLTKNEPVLNAEYGLTTSAFCAADNAAGIMGARYDLELDGKTFEPCW